MFQIKVFQANDIKPYISLISKLRINAFVEYPYLYKGTLEVEEKYMESYANDSRTLFAIAFKGDEVVGVSTGIPVDSQANIVKGVQEKLILNHVDHKKYYCYGDVIILSEYRGNHLTTKLFQAKENIVKVWGYTHACFLSVRRDFDDLRKPKNYLSPEVIWQRLGFTKIPACAINFNWDTILIDGSHKDMENTMDFWQKKISP